MILEPLSSGSGEDSIGIGRESVDADIRFHSCWLSNPSRDTNVIHGHLKHLKQPNLHLVFSTLKNCIITTTHHENTNLA